MFKNKSTSFNKFYYNNNCQYQYYYKSTHLITTNLFTNYSTLNFFKFLNHIEVGGLLRTHNNGLNMYLPKLYQSIQSENFPQPVKKFMLARIDKQKKTNLWLHKISTVPFCKKKYLYFLKKNKRRIFLKRSPLFKNLHLKKVASKKINFFQVYNNLKYFRKSNQLISCQNILLSKPSYTTINRRVFSLNGYLNSSLLVDKTQFTFSPNFYKPKSLLNPKFLLLWQYQVNNQAVFYSLLTVLDWGSKDSFFQNKSPQIMNDNTYTHDALYFEEFVFNTHMSHTLKKLNFYTGVNRLNLKTHTQILLIGSDLPTDLFFFMSFRPMHFESRLIGSNIFTDQSLYRKILPIQKKLFTQPSFKHIDSIFHYLRHSKTLALRYKMQYKWLKWKKYDWSTKHDEVLYFNFFLKTTKTNLTIKKSCFINTYNNKSLFFIPPIRDSTKQLILKTKMSVWTTGVFFKKKPHIPINFKKTIIKNLFKPKLSLFMKKIIKKNKRFHIWMFKGREGPNYVLGEIKLFIINPHTKFPLHFNFMENIYKYNTFKCISLIQLIKPIKNINFSNKFFYKNYPPQQFNPINLLISGFLANNNFLYEWLSVKNYYFSKNSKKVFFWWYWPKKRQLKFNFLLKKLQTHNKIEGNILIWKQIINQLYKRQSNLINTQQLMFICYRVLEKQKFYQIGVLKQLKLYLGVLDGNKNATHKTIKNGVIILKHMQNKYNLLKTKNEGGVLQKQLFAEINQIKLKLKLNILITTQLEAIYRFFLANHRSHNTVFNNLNSILIELEVVNDRFSKEKSFIDQEINFFINFTHISKKLVAASIVALQQSSSFIETEFMLGFLKKYQGWLNFRDLKPFYNFDVKWNVYTIYRKMFYLEYVKTINNSQTKLEFSVLELLNTLYTLLYKQNKLVVGISTKHVDVFKEYRSLLKLIDMEKKRNLYHFLTSIDKKLYKHTRHQKNLILDFKNKFIKTSLYLANITPFLNFNITPILLTGISDPISNAKLIKTGGGLWLKIFFELNKNPNGKEFLKIKTLNPLNFWSNFVIHTDLKKQFPLVFFFSSKRVYLTNNELFNVYIKPHEYMFISNWLYTNRGVFFIKHHWFVKRWQITNPTQYKKYKFIFFHPKYFSNYQQVFYFYHWGRIVNSYNSYKNYIKLTHQQLNINFFLFLQIFFYPIEKFNSCGLYKISTQNNIVFSFRVLLFVDEINMLIENFLKKIWVNWMVVYWGNDFYKFVILTNNNLFNGAKKLTQLFYFYKQLWLYYHGCVLQRISFIKLKHLLNYFKTLQISIVQNIWTTIDLKYCWLVSTIKHILMVQQQHVVHCVRFVESKLLNQKLLHFIYNSGVLWKQICNYQFTHINIIIQIVTKSVNVCNINNFFHVPVQLLCIKWVNFYTMGLNNGLVFLKMLTYETPSLWFLVFKQKKAYLNVLNNYKKNHFITTHTILSFQFISFIYGSVINKLYFASLFKGFNSVQNLGNIVINLLGELLMINQKNFVGYFFIQKQKIFWITKMHKKFFFFTQPLNKIGVPLQHKWNLLMSLIDLKKNVFFFYQHFLKRITNFTYLFKQQDSKIIFTKHHFWLNGELLLMGEIKMFLCRLYEMDTSLFCKKIYYWGFFLKFFRGIYPYLHPYYQTNWTVVQQYAHQNITNYKKLIFYHPLFTQKYDGVHLLKNFFLFSLVNYRYVSVYPIKSSVANLTESFEAYEIATQCYFNKTKLLVLFWYLKLLKLKKLFTNEHILKKNIFVQFNIPQYLDIIPVKTINFLKTTNYKHGVIFQTINFKVEKNPFDINAIDTKLFGFKTPSSKNTDLVSFERVLFTKNWTRRLLLKHTYRYSPPSLTSLILTEKDKIIDSLVLNQRPRNKYYYLPPTKSVNFWKFFILNNFSTINPPLFFDKIIFFPQQNQLKKYPQLTHQYCLNIQNQKLLDAYKHDLLKHVNYQNNTNLKLLGFFKQTKNRLWLLRAKKMGFFKWKKNNSLLKNNKTRMSQKLITLSQNPYALLPYFFDYIAYVPPMSFVYQNYPEYFVDNFRNLLKTRPLQFQNIGFFFTNSDRNFYRCFKKYQFSLNTHWLITHKYENKSNLLFIKRLFKFKFLKFSKHPALFFKKKKIFYKLNNSLFVSPENNLMHMLYMPSILNFNYPNITWFTQHNYYNFFFTKKYGLSPNVLDLNKLSIKANNIIFFIQKNDYVDLIQKFYPFICGELIISNYLAHTLLMWINSGVSSKFFFVSFDFSKSWFKSYLKSKFVGQFIFKTLPIWEYPVEFDSYTPDRDFLWNHYLDLSTQFKLMCFIKDFFTQYGDLVHIKNTWPGAVENFSNKTPIYINFLFINYYFYFPKIFINALLHIFYIKYLIIEDINSEKFFFFRKIYNWFSNFITETLHPQTIIFKIYSLWLISQKIDSVIQYAILEKLQQWFSAVVLHYWLHILGLICFCGLIIVYPTSGLYFLILLTNYFLFSNFLLIFTPYFMLTSAWVVVKTTLSCYLFITKNWLVGNSWMGKLVVFYFYQWYNYGLTFSNKLFLVFNDWVSLLQNTPYQKPFKYVFEINFKQFLKNNWFFLQVYVGYVIPLLNFFFISGFKRLGLIFQTGIIYSIKNTVEKIQELWFEMWGFYYRCGLVKFMKIKYDLLKFYPILWCRYFLKKLWGILLPWVLNCYDQILLVVNNQLLRLRIEIFLFNKNVFILLNWFFFYFYPSLLFFKDTLYFITDALKNNFLTHVILEHRINYVFFGIRLYLSRFFLNNISILIWKKCLFYITRFSLFNFQCLKIYSFIFYIFSNIKFSAITLCGVSCVWLFIRFDLWIYVSELWSTDLFFKKKLISIPVNVDTQTVKLDIIVETNNANVIPNDYTTILTVGVSLCLVSICIIELVLTGTATISTNGVLI